MAIDLQPIIDDIVGIVTREAAAIESGADAKDPAAEPGPFGIAIATTDGTVLTGGAAGTRFPVQSIAKVLALKLAFDAIGEAVFERVGREPSGDPFDSIVDLERNRGIPRNPFINAGALVIVDILVAAFGVKRHAVVDFVARQLGSDGVALDPDVMASEEEGGDLNRAIMSFARHHGNLTSDMDRVMAAYIAQCAVSLDCGELARTGLFLARVGDDGEAMWTRRIVSLMMTCGHYDASGDFAYRVGLPAKSGVGGGILAIMPEMASIAVWSPNLDQHGNSILGVHALEMLAARTGWSVFGSQPR